MRWLSLLILSLSLVLLIPSEASADSSDDITVTAIGFVCEAPGGFTVTYISDYEVSLSWTKGEGAENTMVRACIGREPENRSDGYLVYYGDGESCTDWVNMETLSVPIYYKPWSQNASGVWEEFGGNTGFVEGISMLTIAYVVLAIGLTSIAAWKRQFILYTAACIGLLLIALFLAQTSWAFGIPIGLLSAYMLYKMVTWWF